MKWSSRQWLEMSTDYVMGAYEAGQRGTAKEERQRSDNCDFSVRMAGKIKALYENFSL